MLFTALRKYENGDLTETLPCSDTDFHTALQLSEVYMQHSMLMFQNLPRGGSGGVFKSDKKKMLFEALPVRFTRVEAVITGEQFAIGSRNIAIFRNDAITSNLIKKLKHGVYQKL